MEHGEGRNASASAGDNTEYGAAAVAPRGTRGGGPPCLSQWSSAIRRRSRDIPRPSPPPSGCARATSRRSAAPRGAGRLDASAALAERSRANRQLPAAARAGIAARTCHLLSSRAPPHWPAVVARAAGLGGRAPSPAFFA